MAIEDGVTISTLISADIEKEQIPGRLRLYQKIRRPRVARVRDASRDVAKGLETQEFMRDYMGFLSSHDALEYAKQQLAKSGETGVGNDAPGS